MARKIEIPSKYYDILDCVADDLGLSINDIFLFLVENEFQQVREYIKSKN